MQPRGEAPRAPSTSARLRHARIHKQIALGVVGNFLQWRVDLRGGGAHGSGPFTQLFHVEAIQLGGVLAEHHAALVLRDVLEGQLQGFEVVGKGALIVGVVIAPADFVDPDFMATIQLCQAGETGAVPAVAPGVETGRLLENPVGLRVILPGFTRKRRRSCAYPLTRSGSEPSWTIPGRMTSLRPLDSP